MGRRGDVTVDLAEIRLQFLFVCLFLVESHCKQFCQGQECPLLDVFHPEFPLPTTASPTSRCPEGWFWRGCRHDMCDIPEPCKFPSLDSCQKRFPWTHKEVDLALHPIVGLVLKVAHWEKFPQDLFSKAWILFFFTVSK